jgi:hypothetical protein
VAYGQPLGTQSNQKTAAVHTHMDVNVHYTGQFDRYLKDISSGAIITDGYGSAQAMEQADPAQQATAQRFKDQLGHKLAQFGMGASQIETLSAAAMKETARYTEQGEVSRFLLNKDASSIALELEYPPLREFDVAQALAQTPQQHWQEAAALDRITKAPALVLTKHLPEPKAWRPNGLRLFFLLTFQRSPDIAGR